MLTKIIPVVLFGSYLFAAPYSFDWSCWVQALCAVYVGGTIFVLCFGWSEPSLPGGWKK